jgi:chitinase
MAEDHMEDMTNARKVLIEMRHNWAKTIAAGYKRGESEAAVKSLIEVQEAIDVIDFAIAELEEAEELDDEEED